jgi:hypothetical protein
MAGGWHGMCRLGTNRILEKPLYTRKNGAVIEKKK